MDEIIRRNERCFIGMPACGYAYESAKMCFVACPSDEKYALKVEVIKDIIESKQYECHIALKRIDPGNFAFCTKICSKIIQSQFCIVLLDPSIDDKGLRYPNPNVHLEYGMMMAQNKHIIPLQAEESDLAFNISPLDTIKYTESRFKRMVSKAVDSAIEKFSERKTLMHPAPGPEIITFYNLLGYTLSDITMDFYRLLFGFGGHLGFFLFERKDKYRFVGPFDREDPKKTVLHAKLLIDRMNFMYEGLGSSDRKSAKSGKFDYLVKNISIDIIVPPVYRKKDILNRIKKVADQKYKRDISLYYRSDITKRIEDEYKSIGDIEPMKT